MACVASLPYLGGMTCPRCAAPTPTGETCGACLKTPPAFNSTHSVWAYAFPIDALIHGFKYEKNLSLAPVFSDALVQHVHKSTLPDLIIPMPLHRKRLAERGFNQALEIAKPIAAKLNIPLTWTACTRIKDTAPQISLPRKERHKNMKNAFTCDSDFTDKHIAIVDDVMTTGASVDALATILRSQGAREVSVWVAARTSL